MNTNSNHVPAARSDGFTTDALKAGMTGSALLSHARILAMRQHRGVMLSSFEQAQINLCVKVFSPENFYMDGELFG